MPPIVEPLPTNRQTAIGAQIRKMAGVDLAATSQVVQAKGVAAADRVATSQGSMPAHPVKPRPVKS